MSRKAIKAFYKKIESDKRLQAKVRRVAQKSESEATTKVVKIAAEAGYEFTATELASIRAQRVEYFPGLGKPEPVNPDCCLPGIGEAETSECCHYAQGCMPGFCPITTDE